MTFDRAITLASNVCSLELGSYLAWYREGSETSPLFLVHVTVGVGSPMTMALKKANLPASTSTQVYTYSKHACSHIICVDYAWLKCCYCLVLTIKKQWCSVVNLVSATGLPTLLDSQSNWLASEVWMACSLWQRLNKLCNHHSRDLRFFLDRYCHIANKTKCQSQYILQHFVLKLPPA